MPDVVVSNPDRVVFPKIGLTKGELVDYYARVAPQMVPHLVGRPLTIQIFPKGVDEPGSFLKERRKHFPDWVASAEVPKKGGTIVMPVIDSADALKYIANQGMVVPHVWLTRSDDPLHPDRMVFDLDPSTDDLGLVRRTALLLRDVLSDRGVVPFVKSTGSRGLHVTVPLDRSAHGDDVRAFAQTIAAELVEREPDTLTTEFSKADRGDRLYLDILRNGWAQTEVAPYGVRPRPTAPVAAPLEWDEIAKFEPEKWTVRNLFRRLAKRDDPWARMDASAGPLPT